MLGCPHCVKSPVCIKHLTCPTVNYDESYVWIVHALHAIWQKLAVFLYFFIFTSWSLKIELMVPRASINLQWNIKLQFKVTDNDKITFFRKCYLQVLNMMQLCNIHFVSDTKASVLPYNLLFMFRSNCDRSIGCATYSLYCGNSITSTAFQKGSAWKYTFTLYKWNSVAYYGP